MKSTPTLPFSVKRLFLLRKFSDRPAGSFAVPRYLLVIHWVLTNLILPGLLQSLPWQLDKKTMQRLTSKIPLRNFCLLILVLFCATVIMRSGHSAASSTSGGEVITNQALPLQTEVTVHAANRGRPWINLADGHQLQTSYKGAAKAMFLAGGGIQPRSLASADFSGDGFTDLIVGYSSADGGSIALHRLNPEALAPKLRENQAAIAKLNYPAPFLSDTNTIRTPIARSAFVLCKARLDPQAKVRISNAAHRGQALSRDHP